MLKTIDEIRTLVGKEERIYRSYRKKIEESPAKKKEMLAKVEENKRLADLQDDAG